MEEESFLPEIKMIILKLCYVGGEDVYKRN